LPIKVHDKSAVGINQVGICVSVINCTAGCIAEAKGLAVKALSYSWAKDWFTRLTRACNRTRSRDTRGSLVVNKFAIRQYRLASVFAVNAAADTVTYGISTIASVACISTIGCTDASDATIAAASAPGNIIFDDTILYNRTTPTTTGDTTAVSGSDAVASVATPLAIFNNLHVGREERQERKRTV
jgi:hypothetical protein